MFLHLNTVNQCYLQFIAYEQTKKKSNQNHAWTISNKDENCIFTKKMKLFAFQFIVSHFEHIS